MLYVFFTLLCLPLWVRQQKVTVPRRVLVVQAAKIGDFVCTTPLLREIQFAWPEARLWAMVHPIVASLARPLLGAEQVLEVRATELKGWRAKWRLARQLRQFDIDIVFCCNGGFIWPVVLALAGIPVRVGVTPNFTGASTRFAQHLWTHKAVHQSKRLIVETYFDMLRQLGIQPSKPLNTDKRLVQLPEVIGTVESILGSNRIHRKRVAFAMGAANKLKDMPISLLAETVQAVWAYDQDIEIVLLGSAADKVRADALIHQLNQNVQVDFTQRCLTNLCGSLPLEAMPALLRRINLLVGVDSGLTYIADAVACPIVSIAGPCNMAETRPVNPKAIILQKVLPCAPCAHIFRAPYDCHTGTHACVLEFSAQEITAAIIDQLESLNE